MAQPELASRLADYLYGLREKLGEESFPRRAEQYLDDWAADSRGWLRKYYPPGSDEAHYDLTPPTERAIDWLAGFNQRQFVGAESRLMTVFALLREIAQGTEEDPASRIADLEKRKKAIEAEIKSIRDGHVPMLDATQVKDRFQQMAFTARSLLSDFREVEQNFRSLDRAVRERIATWEGNKGTLLEEIFSQRDAIAGSDQGKSFRAFWDFLMSPARQEEFSALLQVVFALKEVDALAPDRRLMRIHYDWLEAGEVAQRTVARLSEQLRRYLDDQAWLENRRIMQLIRGVEQSALAVRRSRALGLLHGAGRARADDRSGDGASAVQPAVQGEIRGGDDHGGRSGAGGRRAVRPDLCGQDAPDGADPAGVADAPQISLADLVKSFPLEQGLAELVAYLSLATEDDAAVIDDGQKQELSLGGRRGYAAKRYAAAGDLHMTATAACEPLAGPDRADERHHQPRRRPRGVAGAAGVAGAGARICRRAGAGTDARRSGRVCLPAAARARPKASPNCRGWWRAANWDIR